MEHLSLAGVIGAGVGVFIGILDFGLVAGLIKRAAGAGKMKGSAASAGRIGEAAMRVLFVVNALVFAGLGYWFGASLGG